MRLPDDIRDLILEYKWAMETHEKHTKLLRELDIEMFFRYVMGFYQAYMDLGTY